MDRAIIFGNQSSFRLKRGSILSVGNNHKLIHPSVEIEKMSNDRITSIESISETSNSESITYKSPKEKSRKGEMIDHRFSFNTPAFNINPTEPRGSKPAFGSSVKLQVQISEGLNPAAP